MYWCMNSLPCDMKTTNIRSKTIAVRMRKETSYTNKHCSVVKTDMNLQVVKKTAQRTRS